MLTFSCVLHVHAGMLGSWMRMKYPHILDGVIAASAPAWAFPGENPPVDSNAFAKTVTRDATPAGGASKACAGCTLTSTTPESSCSSSHNYFKGRKAFTLIPLIKIPA